MQILPGEAHIWNIDTRLITTESYFTKLHAAEKKQLLPWGVKRQQEFIASRGILRHLLSLYLATPAPEIELAYSATKKPYIVSPHTTLQFNLSHSNDLIAYAFTMNGEIGIDVEKIRKIAHQRLAERFFSQAEKNTLIGLPTYLRQQAFFQIWSRKEAILKASGKGLFVPLSSFSVHIEQPQETILLENKSWQVMMLSFDQAYAAHLACSQSLKQLSYWRLMEDEASMILSLGLNPAKKRSSIE